jgi:hypothetical protein
LKKIDVRLFRDEDAKESISKGVLETWAKGPAYTLLIEDEIVLSAGIVLLGWNRGEAWLSASSLISKYQKSSFKIIRGMLDFLAKKSGLKRVQTFTRCDSEISERFVRHLRFGFEGIARNMGPNNEDLKQWAKVY